MSVINYGGLLPEWGAYLRGVRFLDEVNHWEALWPANHLLPRGQLPPTLAPYSVGQCDIHNILYEA